MILGNVELWKNSGSYENGAGQEHSDATHIRAHTNHAISQISCLASTNLSARYF
jgi:hypothetical protein